MKFRHSSQNGKEHLWVIDHLPASNAPLVCQASRSDFLPKILRNLSHARTCQLRHHTTSITTIPLDCLKQN